MVQHRIQLTGSEMLLAGQAGVLRSIQHRVKNTKQRHGAQNGPYGWGMDLIGALGEAAVGKWSGRWWSGMGMGIAAGDVGPLEVRCVDSPDRRLILHADDKDESPYILVVAQPPEFILKGWMLGREGKDERFWSDPTGKNRHAFFVPDEELHNMQQLDDIQWT